MRPIRIGIVGVGKIARDQHIPTIRANPAFTFVAAASRHTQAFGVEHFPTFEAMLAGVPDLEAVAICTPTQLHYRTAKLALAKGKHVLLEKPPCSSMAEFESLRRLAHATRRTLYQPWHSQHADGVAPAAELLRKRKLKHVRVTWKEDVRRWHPGQTWIWQPGGFGVLDPGINALSILTRILAEPIFPRVATLFLPSNCSTPIAAELELECDSGVTIRAAFDFRHTGTQTWDIELQTDRGPIRLSAGGGRLTVGTNLASSCPGVLDGEYQSIYRRFAELISLRQSEVDTAPLQLVADIFLIAEMVSVEPFEDTAA